MSVLIETTFGDIVVDLFVDERPRTCTNFLKLCRMKYYNYCPFFFVQRNFIARTGDPSGRGTGGSSIFEHLYGEQARCYEGETRPRMRHRNIGTVSMTATGDHQVASQFFITLGSDLDYLNDVHTIFGQVTEGLDVLGKMNEAICDDQHRPYQDIFISHTHILDDPFANLPDLSFPSRSPSPPLHILESQRLGLEAEINADEGKTLEELQEEEQIKEAKAQAQVLEIIGDVPDADMAPPENVLFVCKLNSVTTAEDLHIIFSRFGAIESCEVIKDHKTGNSLQYAFIEFEKKEDCEKAYFKMDNVLIDDRRIHVDFSQSVSKLRWNRFNEMKRQRAKSGFKKPAVVSALSDDDDNNTDNSQQIQQEKGSQRYPGKRFTYSSDEEVRSRSNDQSKPHKEKDRNPLSSKKKKDINEAHQTSSKSRHARSSYNSDRLTSDRQIEDGTRETSHRSRQSSSEDERPAHRKSPSSKRHSNSVSFHSSEREKKYMKPIEKHRSRKHYSSDSSSSSDSSHRKPNKKAKRKGHKSSHN